MKKEIIISFILGAIISSVVGVIAANTISSSSVIYKDDKTVNTVLDELFETVDAIESDDTRLTSLESKLNTLTSTHSSDVAGINNNINSIRNNLQNFITISEKKISIGANASNVVTVELFTPNFTGTILIDVYARFNEYWGNGSIHFNLNRIPSSESNDGWGTDKHFMTFLPVTKGVPVQLTIGQTNATDSVYDIIYGARYIIL